MCSICDRYRPFSAANLSYIKNTSPANSEASWPPVPGRTSRITFLQVSCMTNQSPLSSTTMLSDIAQMLCSYTQHLPFICWILGNQTLQQLPFQCCYACHCCLQILLGHSCHLTILLIHNEFMQLIHSLCTIRYNTIQYNTIQYN